MLQPVLFQIWLFPCIKNSKNKLLQFGYFNIHRFVYFNILNLFQHSQPLSTFSTSFNILNIFQHSQVQNGFTKCADCIGRPSTNGNSTTTTVRGSCECIFLNHCPVSVIFSCACVCVCVCVCVCMCVCVCNQFSSFCIKNTTWLLYLLQNSLESFY